MPAPGQIAAIQAVRRRRREVNSTRVAPSTGAGQERKDEGTSEAKKEAALRRVMRRYDVNKSGKLEEDQIRLLLTDLDDFTPRGTEPTEEELAFILKVADASGDGCLRLEEVEYAMKAWHVYTKRRQEMEDKLLLFDKSGSGTLTREELHSFLVDLNGGEAVDNMEVDWVMAEADIFGDGQIHKTELVMAVAAWYSHVEQRRTSRACALL